MAFVAPRLIDLAIFGTLGSLWIFGLLFIVALYRWIARDERERASNHDAPSPDTTVNPDPRDPSETPGLSPRAA